MALSERGSGGVAGTMPLRVPDVEQVVAEGGEFREDIARSEVLEYRPPARPRTMDGRFAGPFPVRRVGGLSVSKPAGVEQTERPSGETGTHALPAVEKMTGKPTEFADLHSMARQVQNYNRHLGVHVWYGEYPKEFLVMAPNGLNPFTPLAHMKQK